jgi:YHS domain-containing protein
MLIAKASTARGYERVKKVEGFFPLWRIIGAVTQKLLMKRLKTITAITLATAYLAAPLAGFAAEKKDEKAKPYPLETCIVTDEKLGEMGKPFVFTHEGQEFKLCCKSCQKDFKKDPAKYVKKLKDVEKKVKK